MDVEFRGSHAFLDSSLHFADLRGRNVLLNAARWLVAVAGGASAVHVHVEEVKYVPRELLEFLAYLIYPARIELRRRAADGEGGEELEERSREYMWPFLRYSHKTGACTLCGRSRDSLGGCIAAELRDHVARGEDLCPACMIARLFGRAANKAAFLFYVGREELKLGEPDAEYEDPHSFAVFKFYRHGGGRKAIDDTAVLSACGVTVAVVGVKREVVNEEGMLHRYLSRVSGSLRGGDWRRVAETREEYLRQLVNRVKELDGVDLGDVIYQPRGCGVVAQLSGVNAWGELESTDLDLLASSEGTNIVYVIRVDGDKFGEFSRRYKKEEELAAFKSAVAGAFEASVKSAVVYSGGDESLIAAVSKSALRIIVALEGVRRLYQRLGREAGQNLSISAAVVAARYKTPMYYVVELANRGVEEVKEAGRDGLFFTYLKGLYSGGGIVKFAMLEAVKKAARRFAEEMPNPQDLQQAPELASSVYLGLPYAGPGVATVVKDLASLLET